MTDSKRRIWVGVSQDMFSLICSQQHATRAEILAKIRGPFDAEHAMEAFGVGVSLAPVPTPLAPRDLSAAWTEYLVDLLAISWMYRLGDRVGAGWHGRQALARWRGRVSR